MITKASHRYLLFGAFFGLLFPIIATIIIAFQDFDSLSFSTMLNAQQSNLLLWIIDTAPVFLGLFALMAGLKQEKVNAINLSLEERVKRQTEGIKQINEQLLVEISERKEKETLLLDSMEAAKQGVRSKDQFLSNMSHEIRTPMNGIIGMTDILLNTELDELQHKYLSAIDYSAKNLLVIINDILDLSKINAEKLELEQVNFNIYNVLDSVCKTFEVKIKEKAIGLNLDIEEPLPEKVCGDPVRINQILLNIIGNAIKFTDKGSVTLQCGVLEKNEEHIRLRFAIIDTGIGIKEENLGKIFESFSQANSSINRKFGGTGLGLPISKKLIELHGGTLKVESTLGEGTIFSFDIKLEYPVAEEITVEEVNPIRISAEEKAAIRILLAEDNKINQLVATKFLDRFGFSSDIANNGREAIDKTELKAYDLILMDVQMPEVDGLQATRIIKSSPRNKNKSIKVMAMTASVLKDEVQRCYDAGMDDYISKPFDPNELYNKILNLTKSVVKK
jgi:signal transduction histidine kinase/CheY-like chemotaxis protein